MACIDPNSVDDMENIKCLDDIKGSPELHSKRPLLKELQNLVTPYYATSWKEIGLQLGIAKGILQTIETNFQADVETCCAEMFTEWLDTDVIASWGKLLQVVYSPAVTEIINTFNKSPLNNRKELEESKAVKDLESKLKERHTVTRYRYSEEEDWFSEPEHFTSVALIHQKKHKTKRDIIEFANMHLKGDFIKSGKVTTNIADIFALAEFTGRPYTLLIEGAPGIGKTVLSKEIVFQWANENLLKNEKLVFLLYFRDPKVRKIKTFQSLINYISYSQVSKSIEQYIGSVSGKGVTLVFDGYDEYPDKLRKNSYLSDVINRKIFELQSCNIIITSRPSASGCLHNKVDLRVEILGFTKEHRKSYIIHALKDNPNAIQDLLGYLESNYSVDAYCHVPLSMAILVFLFKESKYNKNELPMTQTAINYKFVRIIIRRFIKKFQEEPLTISNLSEVPKPYKQVLLDISKLAFKALQEDNIVFSANEIRDFCPSLLQDSKCRNGLDLLKAVEFFNLEENSDELSFNFLHFSVQELLAAYHISLMSENNQIKLLNKTFWESRYFNTWIMYVALVKDQPFAFRHFVSGNWLKSSTRFHLWWSGKAYIGISKDMKESKIKRIHLFQCFTEAGNDEMCHYIGNLLQDGTIDLSEQTLSAVEMYTLSSFLARCVHRQWSLLNLSNCYLDDENFERFYKSYASLTKSTVYIDTVNLSSNVFTQVSASQIANLVLNFNVQKLVFASNEIKDIGIDQATFVALLEHPNLTQSRFIEILDENQVILFLYKRALNDSVVSELFIMCCCTVETYMDIYLYTENNSSFFEKFINANSTSIFKSMLHSFINTMTSFSTNFKLFVKPINSTNEEINSIISSLASSAPLAVRIGDSCQPLHLCNISNEIEDENETFSSLGTILFHGKFSIHSMFTLFLGESNLKHIYLNGVTLCVSIMDDFLPKCTSLNTLQLVDCCVHDVTIPNAVANMLSQVLSNTTFLEHLNLSGCRLKTEHMKIILEALKQVVSIITISLSGNNLAYGVFNLLASVITCNRGLKCIELSNCNLQETGIVNIINALKNCENLQLLDLSNNVITDDMAVNVANLIVKCKSIQDLRLQSCLLQYAGMQNITEAMAKKTCLHCIDLSDNAISDQSAMIVANVIENNKNLQKLNFSNCKLQNTVFQQFFQSTAKITSLIHLNLSNNLFTDFVIDSFALMTHQNISLEYLNISGCCDKPKDFEKVTHSLFTLESLRHLDLSCNVINITSANNIAFIITNNAFLDYFNLSKCEFRKSAFLKVICALQNNCYMKYLNLKLSSVGYEEATGIRAVISKNPLLENVDFSNCNLNEQGVEIILSSLRNHTSLKHFDINSNTITNHVVNDIVDVIDSNTQLTHLNISDSDIQEYGILKIFKALQRINTLKSMKMCNCTISDRAAKAIADALSVNFMMEELVFTNNDFHKKGIALIFDVLKEAHTLKSLNISSNFAISDVTIKVTEVVSSNHIMYFDLSNCDLQKNSCSLILNTLILQAPSLQHIDLSANNLSGTAETIAQLISVSYYLQHVNLANTLMQDEEVMMIVKSMQNINSLLHVDLTSYNINDELASELQNTIDKNPAVVSFRFSRLCLKRTEATVTAFGKGIFSVLINLQQISICFTDCENDTVDAVAVLINNSSNLQYLHLENCSLVEINISNFIVALSRTTTLEYFCLINIVITDKIDDGISTVIMNNHQLRHFKLVACRLTDKGLTKSIQSFNFTRLSYLILSKLNNLIIHTTKQLKRPICDSLTHLNLSSVYLDVTKLSFLSLPTLTKLQYLDLSHNPLTDESANILSSVILKNNSLKHLVLCDCMLQSEGIRVMGDPLQTIDITYLDLSHNPLTDESANILSLVILNNIGLQHLDLHDCKLESEGIRVISDSLQAVNVTYLDMCLNTTDVDIFNNNLMPALLSNIKLIEYVYLPCCELKPSDIEKIYGFISNAVNLKYIDVGPNAISKRMVSKCKDIVFVSEGLKYITFNTEGIIKQESLTNYETEKLYHSFHYLNVNDIIIDNHVGDIVAGLIANSPKLEYLEMAGDKWNVTNVMKCFSAIQNNYLMYLNFSNKNNCLNFALTEIFNLLSKHTGLKVLDLHNCSSLKSTKTVITTDSQTFLHLNYLDLSNNYIDDEAADYLTALIAANVGLEYLNFCNCMLSPSGIQNINNALKVSSSLKFLDINFDDINFDDSNSKSLDDDQVVALLATNKYLDHFSFSNLVLDNTKFHQMQSHLCIIKGLRRLSINDCIFTDEDASAIISLIANNPKLLEFTLLDFEMSVKSKMKFTFVSAALDKQCLKLDTITIDNPRNKYSLNVTNTPLHCSVSKLTLTDNDVLAITTVDNNLGELIMFKLILNQNSLEVLSANAVTIRYLKLLHIQDCIFTDYHAHYVASLITNNATTIQSFNLTSCQMSMKQKMMITKALCKLNICLLQYLNIKDILYNAELSTTENFTKPNTNCKLTDDIITAAMTDHINLIISRLVINPETLTELKSNLNAIKGVIHLTINNCIFDVETDKCLASILTNNDCIRELVLSNCSFPYTLSEVFLGLSFLQTLNLISFEKTYFSKNFEDIIRSIITNNPGLSQFTLYRCEITESALVKILHSITQVLRNLLYINFSDLKCSYKVVNHITTVISCSTKLKHINLSNCQLLTVDVKSIIQTAKNLTALEYFDLSCNQVTGYLANDITTLIANNRNIKEMNFSNYTVLITDYHLKLVLNTVTDILVNDIATIIATSTSITKLSLLNCTLNNDQLKVVLNIVKECSVLPCIDFTIEQIENEHVSDVAGDNSRTKQFKKVFNVLVLKNIVVFHQNPDLVRFRRTHHLGIVGCSFGFQEWNVLIQFFTYNTTLNTLILQDCRLYGTISEIVEVCTCLSHLDLTNVKIAGSSKLKSIIPTRLKTFSLNCMDFTDQMMVDILNILHSSKIIDHFAMVNCNLDECRISSLRPVFACRNLLHLDLSYSKISGELVDFILAQSKNLLCVKMTLCNFDKKDVSLVCNGLSKLYNIVHLNMNHNKHICYYASEIAAIIRNNTNLRHIEMAGCNFDMKGIVKICKSLCLCTRLQNINLSHNKITGHAIDAVVSALHSHYLECINLQNCKLKSAGSTKIFTALENIITLKSVDLSLNEMAEDSAVYVAGTIANNKNIEVLCLPDCATSASSNINLSPAYLLSRSMVKCIFDHIKSSKSLRHVEFGSSRVNDVLAKDVAAITSRGLAVVKFSELILTSSGFKQLINSILIIEALNNISITGVHFTNTEACHLATLINNNKSVKSFDISNCVMSDKAKNVIFDAMINLTSLMSLNLKNIVFSGAVEDKVLVVIANNTSLEYLVVTGCEMNMEKLTVCSNFRNFKVVSE